MKKNNSWELGEILKNEFDSETGLAISNLFAIGCFLHQSGEHEAGLKACDSALNALNKSSIKTNFKTIISTLKGNEVEYAKLVSANIEINKLFNNSSNVN